MVKWIIVSLFVFSAIIYASPDAYARRSGSHGHSHGRAPNFSMHRLPAYRSHSRPADPTPSFTYPIYRYKEHPLPRIYSLEKPLINDAGIFQPLNIQQKYYRPDFYRYDHEEGQYSTPRLLHADARAVSSHRFLTVEADGQIFYYDDGFFYKESGKHFIVVAPVINSIVKTIPKSSVNVGITDSQYEYNGIYFKKVPQGYQVIVSPAIKAGF